jgi:hypothetical protein
LPTGTAQGADKLQRHEAYEAVAADVMRFVESQAEPFWKQQLSART